MSGEDTVTIGAFGDKYVVGPECGDGREATLMPLCTCTTVEDAKCVMKAINNYTTLSEAAEKMAEAANNLAAQFLVSSSIHPTWADKERRELYAAVNDYERVKGGA